MDTADNNLAEKETAEETPKGIRRKASGSMIIQISFAGLAFLNASVLSNLLGAESYGAFANAMAWVTILTIPATFGFGILLLRDVAIFQSREEWGKLRGLLRYSTRFVLACSCLVTLLYILTAELLFTSPDKETAKRVMQLSSPLIPLLAMAALKKSSLRALGRVYKALLPNMMLRPGLLLIGTLSVAYLSSMQFSAEHAMTINVIAASLSLTTAIVWLQRTLPIEFKTSVIIPPEKSSAKTASEMMLYGGMQVALSQTDIIMLGMLVSVEQVGFYAVASRLAILLGYGMVAAEIILGPLIAKLTANNEQSKLQHLITKTIRSVWALTIPAGLMVVLCRKWILEIFGPEFTAAQDILIILVAGRLIHVTLGPGALTLSMTGHQKQAACIIAFGAGINIVGNLILIPLYGAFGAAISSAVTLIMIRTTLALTAKAKTGYGVSVFG